MGLVQGIVWLVGINVLLMVVSHFLRFSLYKNIFRGLLANFGPLNSRKHKDVSNKVVLITGGANGLGRLIALRFARLKAKIVLWDIDEKSLERTAEECRLAGAPVAVVYRVDMANRQEVYDAAEKVKSEVGHVDILINNAGIARGGSFLEKDDEFVEKTMRINAIAHFWTVKAFLPRMIETDSGHVVCIASAAGIIGAKDLAEYSASKFAAVGFQEAIENEVYGMGKRHVEFTTVCPLYIQTRMLDDIPLPASAEKLCPEVVVDHVMDAILTNQRILIVPRKMYFLYAFKGLFPRRSIQQFVLQQQK